MDWAAALAIGHFGTSQIFKLVTTFGRRASCDPKRTSVLLRRELAGIANNASLGPVVRWLVSRTQPP